MDFIERLFGVSPDAGDGSTELIYIAALLIATGVLVARIVLKKQHRGAST